MDQSNTSSNEAQRKRNDELIRNSGKLQTNQSADDQTCLLSGCPSGSAFNGTATEFPKQHGMWCRVKALSLTRSGRERGMGLIENDKKEGEPVSRLSKLKRLRKGHARQDGRIIHFTKAERELMKQVSHQELQIQHLNEINEHLLADNKQREAKVAELERKLHFAERRLISSQRQSAKLKGILELAKLQANAQQEVLDVKQHDVIKMAVKQAELYDQIRKLKLTIETLRNKLEKCVAERNGSEYQLQDESAEHPSNMPLPISTTRTMNRMQAAVDARRAVGRQEDHSIRMMGGALNHLVVNFRDSLEETRRSLRRNHKVLLTKHAIAYANRRVKYQRAMNTALRASVKNKDKRIQDLIDENDRIHLVLKRVRQMAETKIEVIYKNLLSLPDAIKMANSPLNVRETVTNYLKEVDSSASVEEVQKIISRLKEFRMFLSSDESFDEFTKNQRAQHKDTNAAPSETASQKGNSEVQHVENGTHRRILRRQKVNRAVLETRRRAAQRMSSRRDPVDMVERKDCRNLGKGGKHCRCCCYDAKIKKLTSLQEAHCVEEKTSLASAESEVVSKPTQESGINQGNMKEMVDNGRQVLLDDTNPQTEEDDMVSHGMMQHPSSDSRGQEECPDCEEQTPLDGGKVGSVTDDLLKDTSSYLLISEGNSQSCQDKPKVPNSATVLTVNPVNVTVELCPEDDLEKQHNLIKRVSDLLVDKWCLEGQVKALVDNERELTVAKSEISFQLDAAHRQLAKSSSYTGRLHTSHNVMALEEKLGHLQRQLKEMEEKRDDDEAVKSQLQSELDECKKKVDDLEVAKKRLEGEVEGWMETVMEVRRGRITLLNHMDNITEKVGQLHLKRSSYNGKEGDSASSDRGGNRSSLEETCACPNHDVMRVNELKADIETLAEQRKIQDSQIGQLSDLLQRANDQKQLLINHLSEVQQEKSNLQFDFDLLIAHE